MSNKVKISFIIAIMFLLAFGTSILIVSCWKSGNEQTAKATAGMTDSIGSSESDSSPESASIAAIDPTSSQEGSDMFSETENVSSRTGQSTPERNQSKNTVKQPSSTSNSTSSSYEPNNPKNTTASGVTGKQPSDGSPNKESESSTSEKTSVNSQSSSSNPEPKKSTNSSNNSTPKTVTSSSSSSAATSNHLYGSPYDIGKIRSDLIAYGESLGMTHRTTHQDGTTRTIDNTSWACNRSISSSTDPEVAKQNLYGDISLAKSNFSLNNFTIQVTGSSSSFTVYVLY